MSTIAALIIDRLTLESQINGGIIMGMGYALLYEERVLDDLSGVMLNPNFETYKLPGIADAAGNRSGAGEYARTRCHRYWRAVHRAHRRCHRQRRCQCHRRAGHESADHPGQSAGRPRKSSACDEVMNTFSYATALSCRLAPAISSRERGAYLQPAATTCSVDAQEYIRRIRHPRQYQVAAGSRPD